MYGMTVSDWLKYEEVVKKLPSWYAMPKRPHLSKEAALKRMNTIRYHRLVHKLSFKEISYFYGISTGRIYQIFQRSERHARAAALRHNPPTNTDPDCVELAWLKHEDKRRRYAKVD